MTIAYLINPSTQQITPFSYEVGQGFDQYLPGGMTVGWCYESGDILYVDDEGLLRPAEAGFRIRSSLDGQPIMSKGILVGREIDLGDTYIVAPPTMTIAEAHDEFQFLSKDVLLEWFRAKANDPAISVSVSGQPTQIIAYWRDILRNLEGKAGGYQP